jgi:hypothetical protein
MLNVVLTEDSIIGWQRDYSLAANPPLYQNDSDYVQRCVLRGSLNGALGEQVNTSSPTAAGAIFLRNYSATLPLTWNENQIHVVAFLYNDSSKEILNVAEDGGFTIVSAIAEMDFENSFTVFPNPASSTFILQLTAPLKNAELIIYDTFGKEMMRKKITDNRTVIVKGNLESGVYFASVRNYERQYVQKIVIE